MSAATTFTVDEAMREKIRAALRANPRQLTMMLARELNVPEAAVVREFPPEQVCELDLSRWEELIRSFEPLGAVQVICTNGAVTLEANGTFGGFSLTGPFFNVQTGSLDMHIRHGQLGAAFAVEKPGHMDGVCTLSVQFFDKSGNSAFKVFLSFGAAPASAERAQAFAALKEKFRAK